MTFNDIPSWFMNFVTFHWSDHKWTWYNSFFTKGLPWFAVIQPRWNEQIFDFSWSVNVNSWLKEALDPEEVWNGLDPVPNAQSDKVIEDLKPQLSRRQSAVPEVIIEQSVLITAPEPEPVGTRTCKLPVATATNPYAVWDDDISAPDYKTKVNIL